LDLGIPEYIEQMEILFLECAVKMPVIQGLNLQLLQSIQIRVLGFALDDGEILFPLLGYDLCVHSNDKV
jgi:hypothetical protein